MLGSRLAFPREYPVHEDVLNVWEMCYSNGCISVYELRGMVTYHAVFLLI